MGDQALQQASIRRVHPQMRAATRDALAQLNAGEVDLEEIIRLHSRCNCPNNPQYSGGQDDAAEIFRSFSRYQQRTVPALVLNLLACSRAYLCPTAITPGPLPMACQTYPTASQRGGACTGRSTPALIDTNAFSPQQLVDQVCVLFLAGHEPQPLPWPWLGTCSATTKHVRTGSEKKCWN